METVIANGRVYMLGKDAPVVVICVDGGAPAYFEDALARGLMPNLQQIISQGVYLLGEGVIPSFTNPNNIAIVTGVTPDVNGICGNYFYDPDLLNADGSRGGEIMMNGPEYLRCDTLFKVFAAHGRRVVVITTKDKLLQLFRHGWKGIAFSAEKAHEATMERNGIEQVLALVGRENPDIYSWEINDFALEAGIKILERIGGDIMYVSLTDYIQHKCAPGTEGSDTFLRALDYRLKQYHDLGVILAVTADHGMNDKTRADGSPNVRYLQTILDTEIGPGSRVILPITDPYVVHHGALGSYATIYVSADLQSKAMACLQAVDGIELVLTRAEAVQRFHLPADRIGDIVVLADAHTVVGVSEDYHDLHHVREGLRSHGGLHEVQVPLILNRPLNDEYQEKWTHGVLFHNYDIFDVALNGVKDRR